MTSINILSLLLVSLLTLAALLDLTAASFSKRSGGGGGGYSMNNIELCQCPNIPAPIKYVAVEVPKPVRVTTIPASSNQMSGIPVVLPDKGGDDGGYRK